MKETISAFIDGEFEGDGLHSRLGQLRADPDLRGAWDVYHLIGDAIRGQVGPEIAARVVARLREEPTVLAPRLRKKTTVERIGWYGLYAAASAAAVVVVVWTAFPGWHTEPQLAANPVATTAEAAPESLVVSVPVSEVENYLWAHQPYSHASTMQGIAPYVRSVADERRPVAK